jgi:surface polysaccharide O-acyltransferase-like enzyme
MIVAMHSPISSSESDGIFLSSLSYLTAPGIGLFFMVSGALLLSVTGSTRMFIKKRFTKIAIPTIIWTLFYLCCNVWLKDEALTLRAVLSIPFSAQGNPVLWFIYTLLGLYLLAPILSRWLAVAGRKELEFYLCLWFISLCYPILSLLADVNTSITGILYYYSGYLGYFLFGYYCRTYPDRLSFRWLLPAMIIVIAIPVACKLLHMEVDFYSLFWYLSLFVAVQCMFWWKIINSFSVKWTNGKKFSILAEVSKLTFGIYLVHIFIMRYLLWKWDFILGIHPYWFQTTVIIILTFIGSFAVSYAISLLPFSKYLIGYDKNNKTN